MNMTLLKKMFLTLLLSLLWTRPTLGIEETILNLKQEAPFRGVLVPPDSYKQYQECELKITHLEDKCNESIQIYESSTEQSHPSTLLSFIVGLMVGGFTFHLVTR